LVGDAGGEKIQEHALLVNRESLRAMISSTYLICLFGAVVHARAMLQLSDVAPEDIVESADNITKTLNGLAMLADMGVLDPLKRHGTASVGAISAGVIIAVVLVVAVAIIAWCAVAMTKQSVVNRNLRLICEEAIRRGDPKRLDECAELLRLSLVASKGGPIEDAAKSIGQAALMVAIAFAAFKLIPPIARVMSGAAKRREKRLA